MHKGEVLMKESSWPSVNVQASEEYSKTWRTKDSKSVGDLINVVSGSMDYSAKVGELLYNLTLTDTDSTAASNASPNTRIFVLVQETCFSLLPYYHAPLSGV